MVVRDEFPAANAVSQTDMSVQGNLLREAEIRRTSWRSEINQTMLWRWFQKRYWKWTILHYTWRRRRTWWYADIMSRAHTTSRSGNIPSERVDSWKIGPALDVKVYFHQGRYCNDIMIESFFFFETEQFLGFASWTESTYTWPKRQKKFPLKALNLSVQGNL